MLKCNKINLIYLTLFLSTLLSFASPRKANAQVVINGYLFKGQELAALENQAGSKFPPGNYQINFYTGDWVYQGPYGQHQGNIYQNQTAPSNPQSVNHPYVGVYDPWSNQNQQQLHIEQDWQNYIQQQQDIQRDFQDYTTQQQDIDYYNMQDFNYSPDYY